MTRPTVARVDLSALCDNYQVAKRLHGGRVLAVVKANAYGHGAVRCAETLQPHADGFAVAAIEEALTLRAAGITKPILLLEGFFEPAELPLIAREGLWTVIHHPWQVEALLKSRLPAPIEVWLKFNSGMNRVGLDELELRHAAQALEQSGKLANLVLMTHFARADETGCNATDLQLDRFSTATVGMNRERSLGNSAGLVYWPRTRADWGRTGIMLYGIDPNTGDQPALPGLRPVMHLHSKIISVREVEAGSPVGYGASFIASERMRLGVVACGYADGYPRAAGTNTPVWVEGRRSRLIGRVSMDMLTVDISHAPGAGVGSFVELWGERIPVSEVAACARTIPYELLCNVKRAVFEYQETA